MPGALMLALWVALGSACGFPPAPDEDEAEVGVLDGGAPAFPFELDASTPLPDVSTLPVEEMGSTGAFPRGMVSLTLDDSLDSQYSAARPALNARGIHATYFVITEAVRSGWSGYMTVPQLQQVMQEGHELGAHTMTHRDLTTLSADEVDTELHGSQDWLKTQFSLPAVPSFASPFGAYNANVLSTAEKYYGSHRTVNGGGNLKSSNILQLRSYDVHTGVSVDTVRGWIDAAAADGTWLILTFHKLVDGTPTLSTEYGTADFAAILDLLPARDVDVVTVAEGVARMDGSKGEGSGDTTVYSDALGDGFTDWSWAPHDFNQRARVRSGLAAISAELDGWKSLYIHHTSGLPASRYSALTLWVNGGETGGQGVRVAFCDGPQKLGSVRLDTVLGHPIQAGLWQQVTIPLSSVGLSSTGTVRDLYIQDDSGLDQGTVYFDDLRLLRAGTSTTPTPTTPSGGTPFTLYADFLDSSFSDWSWATRDMASHGTVHSGTAAISLEPDNWKALFFHTSKGVDLSLYKSISLWVHGGTTGEQVVRVVLKDESKTLGEMRLNAALGHSILKGTWQQVLIPLSALGASTGSLREVLIQDQSGKDQGTLFLDDLQLVP